MMNLKNEWKERKRRNKRTDTNHSKSSRNSQKWLIWSCQNVYLCQFIDVSVIRVAKERERIIRISDIQRSHSIDKLSCSIFSPAFFSKRIGFVILIVLPNYGLNLLSHWISESIPNRIESVSFIYWCNGIVRLFSCASLSIFALLCR